MQREFLKITAQDELLRITGQSGADKIEFTIDEFGSTFNVTAIKDAHDKWSVVRILRANLNSD